MCLYLLQFSLSKTFLLPVLFSVNHPQSSKYLQMVRSSRGNVLLLSDSTIRLSMQKLIQSITQRLSTHYEAGESRALALLLCNELFGWRTAQIYAGYETTLTAEEMARLEAAVQRLCRYEPVQHILGYADFAGHRFRVSGDVLIPRPETAELVEHIRQTQPQPRRVLDIGTGSGCIAIALSLAWPMAEVEAWDVSPAALEMARTNNSDLGASVRFRLHDVFQTPPAEAQGYDLWVSNPPYITESERKDMEPNVLLWEPATALFVPDDEPLRYYRRIAELGLMGLRPGGRLWLEINRAYAEPLVCLLRELGYKDVRSMDDSFQNPRFVTACR